MAATPNSSADHRKKWDREEYEKLALERLRAEKAKDAEEKEVPVEREMLKARDYKVDLDSKYVTINASYCYSYSRLIRLSLLCKFCSK